MVLFRAWDSDILPGMLRTCTDLPGMSEMNMMVRLPARFRESS